MELTLFYFLIAFSFVCLIASRIFRHTMGLGVGMIGGCLFIVTGLEVGTAANPITSTIAFDSQTTTSVPLSFGMDVGIIMIILILLGIVTVMTSVLDVMK